MHFTKEQKGQAFVDFPSTLAGIVFLLTLGLLLAQIMPAFIGNWIAPTVSNLPSGAITMFLYYFIFPMSVIITIFVIGKNLINA